MFTQILDEVSEICKENFTANAGDFEKDGLLHCGKCNTPKQCRIEINGTIRVEFCMCDCENQAYLKEREALKAEQNQDLLERRRNTCFHGKWQLYDSRFSADDGTGDRNAFQFFKNYADDFKTAFSENHGLLIYGNVGSGKSFAAACIANQAIENGYTAYFTNFAEIKNNLWNAENKQAFVNDVCSYDLLVIDDFGTESDSSYTSEIVTNIFDTRVTKQKPMILTSNFTPEQLKKGGEIEYQRIISRVLGNCMAIKYVGDDRRNVGRTRHLDFYQKLTGSQAGKE